MEAKELKVGNWVNYENETFFIQDISMFQGIYVSNLFRSVFDSFATYQNKRLAYLEPIPLTEDWLLKFGFEMKTDISFIKDITLVYYKNGKKFTFPYFHGGDRITSIKYVHQLQNLYFALTGKELEYGKER